MATNIIVAKFCADQTRAWTDELWQYDYGQVLVFDGIDLPVAYEVHFANQPHGVNSTTQIGNADGVTIPDQFLQSGEVVYAWVYLHTGEDDGETEYMVTIPVSKRAKPTNQTPTPVQQDAITEAIAALNAAVEDADELAREWENMSATAETLPEGSAATASYSEGTLTLGIPRGDTGEQGIPGQDGEDGAPGAPGEDGFSPEITVQDITGGHRITITDATGTSTVDVMDGEDGQPGQPGQPGATGNGIASITKTGTVGLVDTYTITYTNGTTTTFTVTNGSDATVTVDDELSSTSENPVQNKVINSALSDLTDDINHKQDAPSTLGTDGQIMGLAEINGQLVPVWINPLDVQVGGTSVVTSGVANIPIAGVGFGATPGVVSANADYGLNIPSGSLLRVHKASASQLKSGDGEYRPVTPSDQHTATFYGLAKASGDTTQSSSSNPVGTYTDDAKVKIQKMLGIYEAPWELIADVTTTADVGYFIVNTDTNGESFALKKAMIYVEAPKTTTGTRDYMSATWRAVNSEGVESTLMFPNIQWVGAASASLFCYELDCNGVSPQRTSALVASGYGSTASYTNTANYVNSGSAIYLKWISLVQYNNNSSLIPSGTRVRIYGQRYVQ